MDLDRIFAPFEQGDNSATRRFQDTGLGLSLTRSLVELHGGKIRAESEGAGKGSSFRALIPKNLGDLRSDEFEVSRSFGRPLESPPDRMRLKTAG